MELHQPVKRRDGNGLVMLEKFNRIKGKKLGDSDTDAELAAHPILWKPMDLRTVERLLFAGKRSSEK